MRDLIIITDKPITPESCTDILIKRFEKSLILLNKDNETLYMKRKQRGFELWFSPDDVLDDPECMMEDTVDKCPNKKAYLTNLRYTSHSIAAALVKEIAPLYGNMWIEKNEKNEWFGTVEEFLKLSD